MVGLMGFYSETPVKAARKRHRCEACLRAIEAGEPYLRIGGQFDDGRPGSWAYHTDCRAEEVRINDDLHGDRTLLADEWAPLHEIVAEGGAEELDALPPAVRARFQRDEA
jgi:hypothetical protein